MCERTGRGGNTLGFVERPLTFGFLDLLFFPFVLLLLDNVFLLLLYLLAVFWSPAVLVAAACGVILTCHAERRNTDVCLARLRRPLDCPVSVQTTPMRSENQGARHLRHQQCGGFRAIGAVSTINSLQMPLWLHRDAAGDTIDTSSHGGIQSYSPRGGVDRLESNGSCTEAKQVVHCTLNVAIER